MRELTRRELLQRSGLGLGALGLAGLLGDTGLAASPLAPKAPHFPGRAKRVVHFFLNGGPSHVDTFDPKPSLAKYAGKPLPETLRTERKNQTRALKRKSMAVSAPTGQTCSVISV